MIIRRLPKRYNNLLTPRRVLTKKLYGIKFAWITKKMFPSAHIAENTFKTLRVWLINLS